MAIEDIIEIVIAIVLLVILAYTYMIGNEGFIVIRNGLERSRELTRGDIDSAILTFIMGLALIWGFGLNI